MADLNQQANRNDDLLRHLVIRIDPRISDTLISHAQQTVRQSSPAAPEKSSGPPQVEKEKAKEKDVEDVSVATVEAE